MEPRHSYPQRWTAPPAASPRANEAVPVKSRLRGAEQLRKLVGRHILLLGGQGQADCKSRHPPRVRPRGVLRSFLIPRPALPRQSKAQAPAQAQCHTLLLPFVPLRLLRGFRAVMTDVISPRAPWAPISESYPGLQR